MRRIVIGIMMLPLLAWGQTLEECQEAALRNYPLIHQYDLISRTTNLTVDNIGKGWLPQVAASAQATVQSDVTAWPDEMQSLMRSMGVDLKGLKRDQYRVGIDVQQTLYDGGAIRSQKQVAQEQGAVQEAQTEVTMYQVRRRVNEMYFALLLLDEQIRQNRDLQDVLQGNERKLQSMYKRGTASESDWLNVKAERLNVAQQLTSLTANRQTLARMLSSFCGIEVETLSKPSRLTTIEASDMSRPELRLTDAQLRLADAQDQALRSKLMPRLGVFAQGFYGYPGYNLFEDMMHHRWSLNGMVGARLTWNIGGLYTHKNDKARIQLQREQAMNARDVFLFNNRLEQLQQNENLMRWQRLMDEDDEIIRLRSAVRKAAESKLEHGIIDVNDLMREVNSESTAKVQRSMHEVQLLKEIYDLKYTTNN
ncbi:MAG: TolC family protein [Bacteroidaceae bacterium]|nr:TolC family protein [Bacteroidaceae bacterium]